MIPAIMFICAMVSFATKHWIIGIAFLLATFVTLAA